MQRRSSTRSSSKMNKTKAASKKPRRSTAASKASQASPKITFRPRKADDDAYIIHLTEEQLGSIHEQSFQERFPREQFMRYLESGAPTFIVERNGKRIGYFSYLIGPDAKMHISAMVIEPQHQSDGIGTTVMQQLENDAVNQGVQVLEVFVQSSNEKSLAFTRKLGFVEVYRVTPTTICFQKRLATVAPGVTNPSVAAGQLPGFGYSEW